MSSYFPVMFRINLWPWREACQMWDGMEHLTQGWSCGCFGGKFQASAFLVQQVVWVLEEAGEKQAGRTQHFSHGMG